MGGKRVKLGMSYDPLKPILPWSPIWEVLENKEVSLAADKEEPEQDEADLTLVREDLVVKFEARLGIAPQLRLDCFGEYGNLAKDLPVDGASASNPLLLTSSNDFYHRLCMGRHWNIHRH